MAERIDINRASRAQLTELPGVGGGLADRILAHRARVGRFDSVEDLVHVSGVSERVLDRFRDQITTGRGGGEPPKRPLAKLLVVLDAGGDGGDFSGHQVTVEGTRSDEELGPVRFAAAAPTTPAGQATLEVPRADTLIDEVTVTAVAPDGAELASRTLAGPELPERLVIEVTPREYGTTRPNTDPSAGRPTRIRGRVIDSGGARPPAGLQVVLWGADVAEPDAGDFRALVVATTDALGHFSGPYPLGSFSAAHATVAVAGEPQTVEVHLAEGGAFAELLILVIDLPEVDAEDKACACDDDVPRSPDSTELGRADGTFSSDPGAGRCVDFTKPDRTLEEFSFSYLVRTTEPEIHGLTLDEPPKIDRRRIVDYLPPVREPKVLAARVGGEAAEAEREVDAAAAALADVRLDARVLKTLARDPDGFSLATVANAARLTLHGDLQRLLGATVSPRPGRRPMSCDHAIDWDDDPTIYQACTIAHGHILRFKQEWVADGYSMGNLLYSLPLAPGQKRQVAILDWERRESAARTEAVEVREALDALVERDRDVTEIVTGTLTESVRGHSESSSGSIAGGLGVAGIFGPVGAVLGVGGGFASADSDAWQSSSRNTAANALNQLRDRTIQSASSVRTQRSTVVQTAAQGERVTATSEVVANYNHCHAITVQYFEVLRHLLVRQRLADVQECLFVPLLMSWFTAAKARRWRHTLSGAVPRPLRGGLGALDRIANSYVGSDFPLGRYADEPLEAVDGELRVRFQLTRPRDKDDDFDAAAWNPLLKLFGFDPKDFYDNFLRDQQFKDRVFLEQLGPKIASSVVGLLRVHALKTDGTAVDLQIDPTLLSSFVNDQTMYVTLRMAADLPPVNRADIKAVIVSSRLNLPGFPLVIDALPAGCRVIVESGSMRYRTAHRSDHLFRDSFIRNDLTGTDDVRIETPLNRQELRNPREEDKELVRNLLDHLNENIERYHHILWARMSPDRRYMLLDGFVAPNSDGRSVASVVDNELIGIVGNCLVLSVARGFHLDPTFNQDVENPIDLLEHYQPNTPIDPTRVAIPTRGVYAEAVMGACNSCEVKDETRFWRWEESPIPDQPTSILPISTESRRAEPPDLTAKDFPAPIIAMQSAPAAPDPTGLAAAFQLLGQAGAFRDITGLEGTQRNAAAALEGAFQTATTFGTKAADLALQAKMTKDIDKAMKTIQSAHAQGLIDDEQAAKLTETAIRGLVGAGTTNPPASTTQKEVEQLTETAGQNNAAVKVTRPTGEQVEVDARSKEDTTSKPIIILTAESESPANRAFRPGANDKSGIITVEGTFRNAPEGSRLRWSSPDPAALKIDSPGSERTRVRGLLPGRRDLDVELLDAGGNRIASIKLKLSVPQYVKVVEDAAAFNTALDAIHLPAQKDAVIGHAKPVVEHLLRNANARVYWQVGALNEQVPAHVPASSVMTVTIRNTSGEERLLGETHPPGGLDRFDEKVDIYPGAYDDPGGVTDIDTETQGLVIQLESSLVSDPALEDVAATVFGRLIGETMAHEITHGLLWDQINPPSDHNDPPIANDLMNAGRDRLFGQRTGMRNTAQVSPVLPEHFVDRGLADIGGLQAVNQALMDKAFPVPPALR